MSNPPEIPITDDKYQIDEVEHQPPSLNRNADDQGYDVHSIDKVQRKLKQRHVQMIAIGKL